MKTDKLIFAKGTEKAFYILIISEEKGQLLVSRIYEPATFEDFLRETKEVCLEYNPALLFYDCSLYKNNFEELRLFLATNDIQARGYLPKGTLEDRVASCDGWIENHVIINDKYTGFINTVSSYMPGEDKENAALEILCDAVKYARNYYLI